MRLKNILLLPLIILKAIFYWSITNKKNLLGKVFAEFGRTIGWKILFKNKESIPLLLAPVSIVRYFEFDFVKSNLLGAQNINVLDVSSPYLFAFYLCSNNTLNYQYINPDARDTAKIKSIKKELKFSSALSINEMDATNLPFENNFFDCILSISVIEHIHFDGDSKAIVEMWRTLKPGGKLILSFPIQKDFEEEYRNENVYELKAQTKEEKYFFQRYYNRQAIKERLLSKISNYTIDSQEFFGETSKGFFKNYESRWIKNGISETVKDPYYISKHFKKYNSIEELPGMGVIGITLTKQQ